MNTKTGKSIARIPLCDGQSPLQSTEGNHEVLFQLIATDTNDPQNKSTAAQIMRALYEGTIASDQVSFSLLEVDSKENAHSKDGSLLPVPKESKSVAVVCKSFALESEVPQSTKAPLTLEGEMK